MPASPPDPLPQFFAGSPLFNFGYGVVVQNGQRVNTVPYLFCPLARVLALKPVQQPKRSGHVWPSRPTAATWFGKQQGSEEPRGAVLQFGIRNEEVPVALV